ncbi:terminase family protein [Microbacterium sp. ZXX196]|uniref:terminase large subunit domain-containing protein n=1 Tax=Microbacterium sp. ZXX196 TaxID=2609291 RepID=UPI0012B87966|nr:terminase family protein [Microbacterium sp. ZXX196]MTE24838.1 terminase [Microbacterium sp. ZXX196]
MPSTSPKTRSSTPRLSEQAKHLSVPTGIVSSGWPAVRKTCVEKLGAEFDPWQDNAGRLILSKREDGTLAVMVDGVGMSLPRQVGKTHLLSFLVFALCVNQPGLLVIWTAHHMATSTETFLALQGFADRAKVRPHVAKVYTGSGDEEIRFHNGSRILFGARERGFGRGIPGVDVLIFDEAQILSDKAMSNMLATMNTSQFGLQLYIGTPPKPEDASETFKRMRREALAGTLEDGAWIEFGADGDAASDDRKQWRKMNPSFPKRTPVQSLMRLKRKLTDADWRREGMGIWDDDAEGSRLIPADVWGRSGVEEAPDGVRSIAVVFSRDGGRVATAGAVKHADGVHAELIAAYSGPAESGTAQLADWLAERWRDLAMIALSGAASAGLFQALVDRGVPRRLIHTLTTAEYFGANAMVLDALQSDPPLVTHPGEVPGDVLSASVAVSDMKRRGQNGQWGWEPTVPDGDETPVEAFSVAHWAARTSRRTPGRKTRATVMR